MILYNILYFILGTYTPRKEIQASSINKKYNMYNNSISLNNDDVVYI